VWTGADATGIGLVDSLGGLDAAVDVARRKAALPGSAPVRIYPRSHPLDRLRPPASSEERPAARTAMFAEAWGPVWQLAADAGLPSSGPLLLPGRWVIQ
jgi:protease-4